MKISLNKTRFVHNILASNIDYNIQNFDTIEYYSTTKRNVDAFLKDFALNKNFEVFYVCDSFIEAFKSAEDKLAPIIENNKDFENKIFRRIIFYDKSVYFFEQNLENIKLVRFDSGVLFFGLFTKNLNKDSITKEDYFLSNIIFQLDTVLEKKHIISEELDFIYALQVFIRYCPLENKFIQGKSRIKENNIKYINESLLDITLLNSLYFTNIYRANGFKVKGHFRLQPYKDNKKLIWISDFEKKGYNRKASKLAND